MNNLIFIPDNWGYSNGGINTINMELCKSIISLKQNNICIYCLVIYCSESTVKEAKEEYGVNIISLYTKKPERRRFESNDVYAILDKLQIADNNNGINWVIGHDVISGEFALNLCKSLNEKTQCFNCRTAIIHHMDYEDYMVYKKSYDSARITEQKSILTKADVLFAVGPRLQRSAQKIKQSKNCPIITPGIDNNIDHVQEYILSDPFRIIVCGRLDKDDDIIKNGELAIKAIASIIKDDSRFNNTTLSLIGCSEDQKNYIQSIGEKYAGRLITVNPYNYMDHSALISEIASHSLCVMPSLREGFGLTGWEAISVGVPTIISEQSGLYELLNTPKYRGYISPVDIKGGKLNEKHDIKSLKNAIINTYNEYDCSKKNSLEFRQILIDDGYMWINTAKKFLQDLSIYDKEVPIIRNVKFCYDVFTDRVNIINMIFTLIKNKMRVINIYGRKGIGKSSILKFFTDGINNTLSSGNMDKKHYFKKHQNIIDNLNAIYIELSSQSNIIDVLQDSYPELNDTSKSNIFEQFINILRRDKPNKTLIIILDNANNDGISEDIDQLIDVLMHSLYYDFCVIISSTKVQSFHQISSNYHYCINVSPFDKDDIIAYADNNNIVHDELLISSIQKVSSGLPVYIKLLLKQSKSYQGGQNPVDMETYLKDQLNLIKINNPECHKIIVYSALLSLIFDNNDGVPIMYIQKKCSIQNIRYYIELLEIEYSLIEFNRGNNCIRIHDVIRDIIIKINLGNNTVNVRDVLNIISEDYKLQRSCYILLLDYLYQATDDEKQEVVNNIKESVDKGNYVFLISMKDQFVKSHNITVFNFKNDCELYLYIAWGCIEAYMGLGNYPEANNIAKQCILNVRPQKKTEIHLKILLTIANLKHLMNEYGGAIDDYLLILEYIKEYPNYQEYLSICYWGIAHSSRHVGMDMDMAICNYNEAIKYGEYNTLYNLKSIREIAVTYLLLNKPEDADIYFSNLINLLNSLPEEKYASVRIGVKRYKALAMRMYDSTNIETLDMLNSAREAYHRIGQRLEYNTLFEIGEVHRILGNYDNAVLKYMEARELALRNHDNNLDTMCSIAIVLCDIISGNNFTNRFLQSANKDILIAIIEKCKNYKLYINEQFANILLDYVSERKPAFETIRAFREIGMIKEADTFENLDKSILSKITFILL